MGFYQFQRKQLIQLPIDELWDFISSPKNLQKITPSSMGFEITSENIPDKIYAGMLIRYKIAPLLGLKMTWVTEITQVEEGRYFVDEQRVGPYKIWHHQHFLEVTPEGTLMTDIVSYKPPFKILGNLANQALIKRKLREIFDYRAIALTELFRA